MITKFFYALIVLILSNYSDLRAQEYSNTFMLKESVLVDSLQLRIDFLKSNQSYLVRLFYNQEIVDEVLLFNVEMNSRTNRIKPLVLDDLVKRVSLLQSFSVVSSTFGASMILIIWNDGNTWNLTKAPFIRSNIIDVDGDGIFEFKETYGVFSEKVFRFRFGHFIER
jgi:hypothetical protein